MCSNFQRARVMEAIVATKRGAGGGWKQTVGEYWGRLPVEYWDCERAGEDSSKRINPEFLLVNQVNGPVSRDAFLPQGALWGRSRAGQGVG